MGRDERMRETEEKDIEAGGSPRSEAGGPQEPSGRPAPSWRAWVISILVAVILSVTATLLLGGSFRLTGNVASTGCGSGGSCCPLPDTGK
ncbi:MAG: hypothetical protein HZA60_02310 [Deltaproteobacteria bacterium]|nr:hypothetical protein [Deltaproteobacteria bacterium]